MYLIEENSFGRLVAVGKYGVMTIHVFHCSENLEDLREDVANLYVVAEECTNYARLHLVTDFSKDEALQQIDEYLREEEGVEETHLIGVFEAKI